MDEEKHIDIKIFPGITEVWKAAADSFPDKNLRKYFSNFDNFFKFYNRMNGYFHDEEVRFEMMFILNPELKKIADANFDPADANTWASSIGWY